MSTNMKNPNEKTAVKNEKIYVIASIGGENYGIDVMNVTSINGMTSIRPIPESKPFMKGVIVLHEIIIPVIDMRIRFNLDSATKSPSNVTVIVRAHEKLIGLIVDCVIDVTSLPEMSIQDTPHFSTNLDTDCVSGMSEINGKLVVLLNINNIVSRDDMDCAGIDNNITGFRNIDIHPDAAGL